MPIEKTKIDTETGQEANTHRIENMSFPRNTGKVLCWVVSTKEGYPQPISEDWKHLTMAEFEAAEPTTEHGDFINVALSKAYVALDAKYFNPPITELEEPEAE